ncbi:hypothetical protein BDW02DRAFT_566311 [Decorospora gaudefroyi]|uniref:tRNA(Ile)-lysidine synthetase n=1 Tax=Decorospora gaudefroyi TaxID=184978 RepID=A0A6A5KQ85_9PLEO|nr:hypothetical protein BDW02DRAFT_566311 [Decorospora gaudefroyi]
MWRSNVLTLRSCSSTAGINYGLNTRWYSAERRLPITHKDFEYALRRVFRWDHKTESKMQLAFAISGGVDSMALAALYTEAKAANSLLPKPYGFIVDHRVRPESTEEAEWVSQQLRSKLFGMESTILPLTWPEDVDFADLKRFETEARTRRYQALGRACRDMKITSLMVAHHANDQAETVMMRLANNRLRSGLQAMQSVEWIPECEGIHGVHHSGKSQRPDGSLNIPFPVEQGGIQILRPLLGFEKERLIATCEEKDVAWAEDKTNQIQTLTSRNAIRHIYTNHKLPEALSVKSLVDVSIRMQERIKWHTTYARELFDQCLIRLDIQTGCLLVRFPPCSDLLPRPIETQADKVQAKNTAYCLVERVAELVTPRSKASLGQLATTIDRIYPELEDLGDSELEHWAGVQKKNHSVFNVWWRFWNQPSPFTNHLEDDLDPSLPHPREWLLTRQPLDATSRADPANNIVYPPSQPPSLGSPTSRRETHQLFDGRFWIHIRNLTQDTLILRIFQKTDFSHFPTYQQNRVKVLESDTGRPYRYISAAFDLLKPADLRFTLPAVFRKDSVTGAETLIGFPTLDVRMDGFGPPEGVCEWSVRYKKIEFGGRQPGDIIVPGTSRKDIIAEERKQKMVHQRAKLKTMGKEIGSGAGTQERDSDVFTGYKRGVLVDGDRKLRAKASGEASELDRKEGTERVEFLDKEGEGGGENLRKMDKQKTAVFKVADEEHGQLRWKKVGV